MRYLDVNDQQARYNLCIWRLKCNKQGTIDVLRGENATSTVRLMYLEVKMQQVRYDWVI